MTIIMERASHSPPADDPMDYTALPDRQLRSAQAAAAKAAKRAEQVANDEHSSKYARAKNKAEARKQEQLRDYLRDLLLQRRLASDPEYAEEDARRRERILADPDMDKREKDLWLSRTIVDNTQIEALTGLTLHRLWTLATPRHGEKVPRPHPKVTPEPDVSLRGDPSEAPDNMSAGYQLGKVIEWWKHSHRGVWDAINGRYVRNRHQRHGRRPAAPRLRPRKTRGPRGEDS